MVSTDIRSVVVIRVILSQGTCKWQMRLYVYTHLTQPPEVIVIIYEQ